jgi:hypothetical protein
MVFTTPQELNIDETAGIQPNEIATLPANFAFLTAYSPKATGGLDTAFPIISYNSTFLSFTAPDGTTVSDLAFTHLDSATNKQVAFSTTVGFPTTLKDIDGNTIYLFADPAHTDVLLGRTTATSTGSTSDLNSPIAFAIALDESANHTSAGAYIVLFEAMRHLNPGDPNDVIDLTNFVNVSTATTTTTTDIFSKFADVPSGNTDYAIIAPDSAVIGQSGANQLLVTGQVLSTKGKTTTSVDTTVNVSEQGLGSGSQAVGENATLQIDYITGGTQSTGSFSQISYTKHVENITETSFVLTQVNPNGTTVDLTVAGWNDKVDATAPAKTTGKPGDADNVTLTGVTVLDANGQPAAGVTTTINSSGDAVIKGLEFGDKVVVTSAGMDRITIANNGPNKNSSFDVGAIQFTATNVTTGADTVDVGSHINIYDDGPSLTAAAAFTGLVADESFFGTDPTAPIAALFTVSGGSDEANATTSGYSLVATGGVNTGLIDTATNTAIQLVQVDATHVEGRAGSLVVFEVSLTGSTLKLDQRLAIEHAVSDPDNPDQAISINASLANLLQIKGTLVDKDGDAATPVLINIADKLTFKDDGPTIDQTISGGNVAFKTGQHLTDTSITWSGGGDLSATGLQIGTYTDLAGVTEVLSADGKSVQYSNASGNLFNFALTEDPISHVAGYDFTVQQTQQNSTSTLNFEGIANGGPKEIIDVPTGDEKSTVRIDGLIVTNDTDPRLSVNNPGAGSDNDDANPDEVGFGIKGTQGSNMNHNEGFSAQLFNGVAPTPLTDAELQRFTFDMQAIGNTVKSVDVTYWLLDDGVLSAPVTTTVTNFPSGQGLVPFVINAPDGADKIFVEFEYWADAAKTVPITNIGVRLLNFTETQKTTFAAADLAFALKVDDNDTDTATSNTINIRVDPGMAIL